MSGMQISQGMLGAIIRLVNHGVVQGTVDIYVKEIEYTGTTKLWCIGWYEGDGSWYFPMSSWSRLSLHERKQISTFYRIKDKSFQALLSRGILKLVDIAGLSGKVYKVDFGVLFSRYYAKDDVPGLYLRGVISHDIELSYKFMDVYIRNVMLPKMYDEFDDFSKLDSYSVRLSRRSSKVENNIYEEVWLVSYVDQQGYGTAVHFVLGLDLVTRSGYGLLQGIASKKDFAKVELDDIDLDYFIGALAYKKKIK